MPTPLALRDLSLDAEVAGDAASAQAELVRLSSDAAFAHNTEGVARLLLRAESVSSSYIEGLTIGARRLLRAEAAVRERGLGHADENALAIIGNIHAMEDAIDEAQDAHEVMVDTICGIHRRLCAGTQLEQWGGRIREVQNWIGGSSYNPLQADYVPPAPELVPELLEDLAAFCNDRVISPIEQAAVAHAQFESIHPFIDGNGRTGRALIHLVLRRRGVTGKLVAPISLVLATHARDYVQCLQGFAFDDADGEQAARAGLNDWVSEFSGCCLAACRELVGFDARMKELRDRWEDGLGRVRRESALDKALDEFVGMPVFSVAMLAEALGRSISSVSEAVERCVQAGVVQQVGRGSRNRVFEVPDVVAEYARLERQLASPVGDTAVVRPVRPVPQRY